ncbi:MAG TPA: hypothetical protein VLM40_15580 [Gemmata sp.]|nr:hypothetical protein [Gemmata sp.]
MKRFFVAAVAAITLGLVASEKASAQIVYNYTRATPGGYAAGGGYSTPYASQVYRTFYSPYTGTMWGRTLYTNSFGQAYGRSYRSSPVVGTMSQNTGFFMPGLAFNPYNGGSLGLNMFPGFGMGSTYQFYGYNPGAYYGYSMMNPLAGTMLPYVYGGFWGRRW